MFADEESETPYIPVIKLMYFNLITFYTSSQWFISVPAFKPKRKFVE